MYSAVVIDSNTLALLLFDVDGAAAAGERRPEAQGFLCLDGRHLSIKERRPDWL